MKTKTTTTPSPSLHRKGNRLVNSLNIITMKRILPLWKLLFIHIFFTVWHECIGLNYYLYIIDY